jgi:hypothetical protein
VGESASDRSGILRRHHSLLLGPATRHLAPARVRLRRLPARTICSRRHPVSGQPPGLRPVLLRIAVPGFLPLALSACADECRAVLLDDLRKLWVPAVGHDKYAALPWC